MNQPFLLCKSALCRFFAACTLLTITTANSVASGSVVEYEVLADQNGVSPLFNRNDTLKSSISRTDKVGGGLSSSQGLDSFETSVEDFTAQEIQGLSVWFEPVRRGKLPYSGKVFKLAANGTGFEYPEYGGGAYQLLSDGIFELVRTPLTWRVNQDGVVILNTSYAEQVELIHDPDDLAEFGFPGDIIDFLNQSADLGLLNSVDYFLSRTVTERRLKAVNRSADRLTASSFEVAYLQIDDILQTLGWEGEFPRVADDQYTVLSMIDVESSEDSDQPFASLGDTLVANFVFEPIDERVLSPYQVAGYGADQLTLLGGGVTTSALISGKIFEWNTLVDGSLLLHSDKDRYILTKIGSIGGLDLTLTEISRDGEPTVYSVDWSAIENSSASNFSSALASIEFPQYFQAGIDISRRDRYWQDGRLSTESIFGYLFNSDGSLRRILGVGHDYPECTQVDSQEFPCFYDDTRNWSWSADNSRIELVMEDGYVRHRQWQVLSYDQQKNSAIVLEWAVFGIYRESGDIEWAWLYFPRLNSLAPGDLALYPEELEAAKEAGYFNF